MKTFGYILMITGTLILVTGAYAKILTYVFMAQIQPEWQGYVAAMIHNFLLT